jgi:2-dehydro-3-deoxyphosphogalactonate aldolase
VGLNTHGWPTALPLVAILRGITPPEVLAHVQAIADAGFDAIEVPLNSPDWAQSLRALVALQWQAPEPHLLVGAGTVLSAADVDAVVATGARLVVTPNTNPGLIRHAVAQGLYVVAGFATASEAYAALDAGAQALKLFPATTYGPGHVKALRAVLPPVPMLAVGGITPGNLGDYVRAGCSGAGLGSDLYRPGQDVARSAAQARAFVDAWRALSPDPA